MQIGITASTGQTVVRTKSFEDYHSARVGTPSLDILGTTKNPQKPKTKIPVVAFIQGVLRFWRKQSSFFLLQSNGRISETSWPKHLLDKAEELQVNVPAATSKLP